MRNFGKPAIPTLESYISAR